jgi:hypothetical protein
MSSEDASEGRYIYCIVNSGEETDFGRMGIENSFVYSLTVKDIGAVVHRQNAELYKTEDKEKAADWFLTHQYVVDLATKEFGTVIPLAFNTIFMGNDETVKEWLNRYYSQLKTLLERLRGKEEYEVQIFLDNKFLMKILEEDEEVRRLREEIEKNNFSGTAYLLKKRQEKRLALINYYAEKLYNRVKELADETLLKNVNNEVLKKWQDKLVILNLSLLVHKDKIQNLRNALTDVNKTEGFAVKLSGPWPPYSFVEEIVKLERG